MRFSEIVAEAPRYGVEFRQVRGRDGSDHGWVVERGLMTCARWFTASARGFGPLAAGLAALLGPKAMPPTGH